jgi:pyruvate,water dikinase
MTTRTGRGAAPGRTTGPAWLLTGTVGDRPPPRSILVARIVHPYEAPLLWRAAGVVVEEPSFLQHVTTLAREFGIPAVVGVTGALEWLRPGDITTIDGTTGDVICAG